MSAKKRKRLKAEKNFDICISNDSSLQRVPRALISRAIVLTATAHGRPRGNISIVVLGDRAIRAINKRFLGHDYATDVITFPLDDLELDGEIYLSADTAARQAREYGVGRTNEILRLVVHGVLHLVGFDDATPQQRQRMHEEENLILDQL